MMNTRRRSTKFTGKERDQESGNDYFGARYYGSNMGRFMSPDDGSGWDISNPQSWNLYAYVMNNPLKFTDPTGRECVWDDGSFDSADDKDTGSQGGCSSARGTYVDPKAFSTLGAGDWSSQENAGIAAVASTLSGSSSSITVNADGSQSITTQGMNLDGMVQTPVTSEGYQPAPYAPNNIPKPSFKDQFKKAALNYLCGTSVENEITQSMVDGAVTGGVTGALEGGIGGGILTGGPGGVPGAILGGWVGGVFGAAGESFTALKWPLFALSSMCTSTLI